MRLVVRPIAARDVQRLVEFLEAKSPRSAVRLGTTLEEAFQLLVDHPLIARATADGAARLWFVRFRRRSSYVIRYRIDGDDLVVMRLWHGKEDRPAE